MNLHSCQKLLSIRGKDAVSISTPFFVLHTSAEQRGFIFEPKLNPEARMQIEANRQRGTSFWDGQVDSRQVSTQMQASAILRENKTETKADTSL